MPCCALTSESSAPCSVASVVTRCSWLHLPTMWGCGKVMKSRMYAKMRSGNRNIYRDYVDFKRWNGKIVPSIERRRKMEYLLLFTP